MNFRLPSQGQDAASLLRNRTGKFVFLNVRTKGETTSVCAFVKNAKSASWWRKERNKTSPLVPAHPSFATTPETIFLSYDEVNALANHFHSIYSGLPQEMFSSKKAALGCVKADGDIMRQILEILEAKSEDIRGISGALGTDLNTSILALRKDKSTSAPLMADDTASRYGCDLLKAFVASQPIYASLPELRGFGTENVGRRKTHPSKRDALLRYYMQHNHANPLRGHQSLDYVDYELKPLNIADTLQWTCETNPRTDSMDLLLSFEKAGVLTEVKMAGDSFVSGALVQLLYYASIMANERQHGRLLRKFSSLARDPLWLCVIAEERDETKPKEAGFSADKDATIGFLKHEETKRVLGEYFQGIFVLIIREELIPFDQKERILAFRVVDGEECRIDWR